MRSYPFHYVREVLCPDEKGLDFNLNSTKTQLVNYTHKLRIDINNNPYNDSLICMYLIVNVYIVQVINTIAGLTIFHQLTQSIL